MADGLCLIDQYTCIKVIDFEEVFFLRLVTDNMKSDLLKHATDVFYMEDGFVSELCLLVFLELLAPVVDNLCILGYFEQFCCFGLQKGEVY